MCCLVAGHVLGARVPESRQVDTSQQVLARPKEDRSDCEVEFVDEAGLQVLPERGDSAPQANVLLARSSLRLGESRLDAVGDEVEHRAAPHGHRGPLMMGEDEDRSVVRWIVTPPAPPGVVRPRTANGAKHVAAHDPRPDPSESACGEIIVGPPGAALPTMRLSECSGADQPFMEVLAAGAERVFEALRGARPEPVDGDGETADEKPSHSLNPPKRTHADVARWAT